MPEDSARVLSWKHAKLRRRDDQQLEVRQAIEGEPFVTDAALISATLSIGITEWQGGELSPAAMQRADTALYQSKGEGRNRLSLAV